MDLCRARAGGEALPPLRRRTTPDCADCTRLHPIAPDCTRLHPIPALARSAASRGSHWRYARTRSLCASFEPRQNDPWLHVRLRAAVPGGKASLRLRRTPFTNCNTKASKFATVTNEKSIVRRQARFTRLRRVIREVVLLAVMPLSALLIPSALLTAPKGRYRVTPFRGGLHCWFSMRSIPAAWASPAAVGQRAQGWQAVHAGSPVPITKQNVRNWHSSCFLMFREKSIQKSQAPT